MKELELKQILAEALNSGANFAEIFIEQKESTAISCEDGNIEKINTGIDYGMGIRVISGALCKTVRARYRCSRQGYTTRI